MGRRGPVLLLASALALSTLVLGGAPAQAAAVTVTVDGGTRFQTMDGFGVSANSEMWKGGQLKPALDMLVDQNGSTVFRVIVDMTDWESTNDNADPNTFNWAYYDQVYSSPKFQDLWATMAYLNSRGITNNLILDFMGRGPAWMGGATLTSAMEDEWVEEVSSAAYYARNTAHVQFGMFAPDNEEDLGAGIEGMAMSASVYADAMNKLAVKLDAIGLTDLRLLGPDTATPNIYWGEMTAYPTLMSKVDHLTFHSYTGDTNGADADIKQSLPGKDFWMDEFSLFDDSFALLSQGAAGLLMWDGYDSAYYHPLLHGATYTPPNDAGNGPALIAYDTTTGVYTPRKELYQFAQLYRFVPAGSQRIGATSSSQSVRVVAFRDPASGRVTVVGENTSSSGQAVALSLAGLTVPPAFQYFQTNASSNLAQGASVPVSGGSASVSVPGDTIFTLTGLPTTGPDVSSPTIRLTTPVYGAVVSGTQTVLATASDDVGVVGVQFSVDGVPLGPEVTTLPYAVTWDTTRFANTAHSLNAVARDAAGNTMRSSIAVRVSN
jgi:O-glycosyl hydrolase